MGWEGVWGLLMTLMLLVPAQLYPCPFNENQCINNHADDVFIAIKQFNAMPVLYLYAFAFLACCTMFNGCGVSITKYSTATNRAIIEQSRVLVIWLFFLLKPGFGHEVFSSQKLLGFFLIVQGVLFFNKILVFDGFGIKYQGGELPKEPKLKQNNSDEDLCLKEEPEGEEDDYILPKLQLEDDNQGSTNSTDTNEK